MPPNLALALAVGSLILGAALGAAVLWGHLQDRPVRLAGPIFHGLFAAAGITLLVIALISAARAENADFGPWPKVVLGALIAVAAGGAFLFSQHMRGRRISRPVAFIHASGAAVSIFILIAVILLRREHNSPVPLDLDKPPPPPPTETPAGTTPPAG